MITLRIFPLVSLSSSTLEPVRFNITFKTRTQQRSAVQCSAVQRRKHLVALTHVCMHIYMQIKVEQAVLGAHHVM